MKGKTSRAERNDYIILLKPIIVSVHCSAHAGFPENGPQDFQSSGNATVLIKGTTTVGLENDRKITVFELSNLSNEK